ncbi:hypothetical protein NP493_1763g00041 [Ridgeia piscesae]|uniref:Uncharacterized protein n=1 Tax=Ridgeia piscesae TaxID=27915 RepID=A0AAD9N954_RIDPI|nr:hypothetical protein NP493_1763g00041 [Ridgeia piscesae]
MSHVYKLTQLHHQNTVNYDLVVTVVNNAMLTATAVRAYNYTAAHTAEVQGDTKASLPMAAIAGGSAASAALIASVTVGVICCLIMKSRTRETHSETNTKGTNGEVNKESDSETPQYTSLQVNNPVYNNKTVDDEDAIYENP